MRFGQDLRLLEARRLLSFTRLVILHPVTDPEPGPQLQAKLQLHASRTLALAVGRGALTLGTLHLLPTEPLLLPKPVLNGMHYSVSPHPFLLSTCTATLEKCNV